MAKLDLTKAHFLRIQFPTVASSLERRERPGQARSDTCPEYCPTHQGGEKSSPCPQAENTTTIKMNKSIKKFRGMFHRLSC